MDEMFVNRLSKSYCFVVVILSVLPFVNASWLTSGEFARYV
jgi:hypothetical protein